MKFNLKQKLELMQKDSFIGWSEDSKNGYLTAVITIDNWIKQNL